jgi:hypothetical protein
VHKNKINIEKINADKYKVKYPEFNGYVLVGIKNLGMSSLEFIPETSVTTGDLQNFPAREIQKLIFKERDSKIENLTYIPKSSSNKDSIIISKIYADFSKRGTYLIAARVAEHLKIDVSTVHAAVRVARKNGWLTSVGPGRGGGELTRQGLEAYGSI